MSQSNEKKSMSVATDLRHVQDFLRASGEYFGLDPMLINRYVQSVNKRRSVDIKLNDW